MTWPHYSRFETIGLIGIAKPVIESELHFKPRRREAAAKKRRLKKTVENVSKCWMTLLDAPDPQLGPPRVARFFSVQQTKMRKKYTK
jgi:hypothetical protein